VYVLLEFWQKIMVIPIMNPLSWFMIYVTISVKTHIVRTSIHIERTKFNKITHATGAGLMGPAISEGSFKSTKTINHLTCLAMESSKIFVSFPWPER